MQTFLDKLVAASSEELEKRKAETPLARVIEMTDRRRPPRDFTGAIAGSPIKLIAEIKRASPSKGELNLSLDAVSLALAYRRGGAAAISIVTEPRFFKGRLPDLTTVADALDIPILRKDFILDEYQVYEARAFGADGVLLIAAMLSDEQMAGLLDLIHRLGMGALIEVHNGIELHRVLAVRNGMSQRGGLAIGINNRDLVDFTVDLETTFKLRRSVPNGITVVSESGIHSREDVLGLQAASVDAVLVGEALVTSEHPEERVRELLGW